MLHLCFKYALSLLQVCFKYALRVLKVCFNDALRMLQVCFGWASGILQVSCRKASRTLTECFKNASRMLQECHTSRLITGLQDVRQWAHNFLGALRYCPSCISAGWYKNMFNKLGAAETHSRFCLGFPMNYPWYRSLLKHMIPLWNLILIQALLL